MSSTPRIALVSAAASLGLDEELALAEVGILEPSSAKMPLGPRLPDIARESTKLECDRNFWTIVEYP